MQLILTESFVIQDHDASNTLFKITGDGDVNIGLYR